jgi:F-type H+-transporting ATPase subunit alpha
MKKVAGRLRLDLAQYRELESFAAFGSDLDRASRAQLERGARLVELLKQPQYAPFPVERQIVSVWAGTTGNLDDVPVEDVRRFEAEFLDFLAERHQGVYDAILQSGELSDDTTHSLEQAIGEFKRQFQLSAGGPPGQDEEAEAMAEEDREQERISAYRKHREEPQQQSGGEG